jgi:chromosome segregation ATPase
VLCAIALFLLILFHQRLTQALVNSEVIETSNKVVLQELSETRTNLTRLTTQQVRSVGLETRLTNITQEKEDIQQERDSADQRARLAEARIVALRDRCSKMQDQLNSLHRDLEEQRSHRLELSEEILLGARAQLKVLHHPVSLLSVNSFHILTFFSLGTGRLSIKMMRSSRCSNPSWPQMKR